MNLSKHALLIIFSIISLVQENIFAQENPLRSDIKIELGVNRSELGLNKLKNEEISGGVGWNANLLYQIHKGIFFGETGLGYRKMKFLISEDLSQTQTFTARASSINIPLLIGTNFLKGNYKNLPILKTGINLDYTLDLNTEHPNFLTKSDIQRFNLTYNISVGLKLNKVELLLSYNTDLKKYVKVIDEKNKYVGLKISYNIFSM